MSSIYFPPRKIRFPAEISKFIVFFSSPFILFNPLSVAQTLDGYIAGKQYVIDDLFYLNELWNSWDHHTRFSDIDASVALRAINDAQARAATCIRNADWVIITLGSAFQYYLIESDRPVANNHRAPAQWFDKRLLSIDEIVNALKDTLGNLFAQNSKVRVLFTISPVRHIRDGVVENNRSKARLIESVHGLCAQFSRAHYFPAYELIIDILRDHRYYDIDMVHPNYQATGYVWDQFVTSCISQTDHKLMEEVNEIVIASRHRPRFPGTSAHKRFKIACIEKAKAIMEKYSHVNLLNEINHFAE